MLIQRHAGRRFAHRARLIAQFQARLNQLNAALWQNVQAIQANAQTALATINAEAAARIAALDSLRNSELSIAKQTVEIRLQAAPSGCGCYNSSPPIRPRRSRRTPSLAFKSRDARART